MCVLVDSLQPPSADDLRAAVMWLEANEGDDVERAPMLRVARWLEQQAAARDERDLAREAGVSVCELRRLMTERGVARGSA